MSTMDERRAMYFAETQRIIKQVGWMVQGVFPTVDDPERFGFAYTVGLAGKQLPELIVFGLGAEAGQRLLNDLARRQIADGRFIAGDKPADLLVGGYESVLIGVKDSTEHLTMANRLYGKPGVQVSALQLLFQDKEHRWPWQPDYAYPQLPVLGDLPEGVS